MMWHNLTGIGSKLHQNRALFLVEKSRKLLVPFLTKNAA